MKSTDNKMAASLLRISEANAMHCPLLQLPAEVRNRIYDFVIEPTSVRLRRTVRYVADKPPYHTYRREALALIHTCRQVRTEALPLYHKAVVPRLHFRNVEEYCDRIFPVTSKVRGQVVVDLNQGLGNAKRELNLQDHNSLACDLLPMINIMRLKPHLNITVQYTGHCLALPLSHVVVETVNAILHPENRDMWYWYCTMYAEAIWALEHPIPVRIQLKVQSLEADCLPWDPELHHDRYADPTPQYQDFAQDPAIQPFLTWLNKFGLGLKVSPFRLIVV
ncbi:hypothetical protein NX059_012040 [Plenodomus lindquistii]|nr:hypothetical protein NX059_012040 [Plenodomus lindquistii]